MNKITDNLADQSLVSVCMATYNGEKYLKEQLDSILKQIKSSDELIISDDGSTDLTCTIIKEYQKEYKNIYFQVDYIIMQ